MASPDRKHHALLVTYPLQGHLIPSVHLAIKLASKGIAVTFVNTHALHRQAASAARVPSDDHDIFAGARASGLDIRYELISDGLPLAFDRSLNHDEFMGSLLHNMSPHVEALATKLLAEADTPITCIVADTFYVWPSPLARKLGLVYVSFWTEAALVFTLYYHVHLLRQNGHFDAPNGNRTDAITYIPGVDALAPCDLVSYFQATDTSTVVHQLAAKGFEGAHAADFVLCNTVEELEQKTISALQLEKPFYSVGPILPQGFATGRVATSLWTESDCTQWLDSKPAGSVLYVSFGSYAHVSKEKLGEIAHGVLDSNVSFIWVLRPDIVSADEPDPLPPGFAEGARGRGLVVTWCRQIEVLTHKSVGGFLTHCGWNSTLESIWSEVPLLCYPLLTDQFTNRKLMVRDWRIGIDLGGINDEVGRGEVKEKIKRLMEGEEGVEMRVRVKELKGRLESAIGPGGSSQKNFDGFVEDLKNHKVGQ